MPGFRGQAGQRRERRESLKTGVDVNYHGAIVRQRRLDHAVSLVGRVNREAERAERTAAITAEIEADKRKVLAAGGLYVLGTERHESRRIDNQLRGRSGRQGDPGRSSFYLSLEDDLMRIFGSERMDGMLRKLGLQDGEAIFHPWINKRGLTTFCPLRFLKGKGGGVEYFLFFSGW